MNHICEIKKKYKNNKNKKYNIICFCLFRLTKLYKNFNQYFDGIILFINYVSSHKILHNVKIRIYYDNSIYLTDDKNELDYIKKTMKLIKKNNFFQLVKYKCKYGGIFPFFFRYIDIFDFLQNDTNYVLVTDIDISHKENYCDYIFNFFYKVIEKKTDFFITHPICYKPFWYKYFDLDKIVLGNKLGGKYKFNHKILLNFIDNVINKNTQPINIFYDNYIKYINNKNISDEFKKKKIFTYQIDKTFVYGLDEFFLSYYLLPYAKEQKIIIYQHISNSNKPNDLYYLVLTLLSNVLNKTNNNKTIKLYAKILSEMYKNKINSNNVILYLTKFIEQLKIHDYNNKTNNEYLYNKFYKYINKYKNNKNLNLNIDKSFNCFLQNNKYYNDYNNYIKLN